VAEQYFTASPSSSADPHDVPFRLDGRDLTLQTAGGVFSGSHVDAGTAVLLEHAPPPPASGRLLDLGCGYGPIACALALRAPGAEVVAVDVNERARELTAANATSLGLSIAVVADHDGPFDAIYSNPPIRIGKAALHELLLRWLDRLAPGGRAYLVVQRNLGSDSLQRWLEGAGHPTVRLTSVRGYRVLAVTKSPTR
jgi:16S rRNA (guanine1207-N2)-methyltransferase